MKTVWVKRKAILDKDGNELLIHDYPEESETDETLDQWLDHIRRKFGHLLNKISLDDVIMEKRAEADEKMTATVEKKVVFDKDGHALSVHPGNGGSPDGDFHAWRMRMREKYGEMLRRISVDEFIAEKRAEAERD